jgi:hypothetical protein
LGSRAPIEITQDAFPKSSAATKIFVTKLYSNAQAYGIIFAIQDFNKEAQKSVELIIDNGGRVGQSAPIKHLGTVVGHNGKTYDYYLVRISANASDNAKAKFTFGIAYYSSKLPEGKMKLNVYGGYIFDQLSLNQYNEANLTDTDKHHFPYHKDFESLKFKSVMKGDTLLAGYEQSDGTIIPTSKLKIAETNLLLSTQLHLGKIILKYIRNAFGNSVVGTLNMTSPSQSTSGWCHAKPLAGYPEPVYPIVGKNPLRLTLLTHVFDDDQVIGNDLELEFRLVMYTSGVDTGTPITIGTIIYKDKKQSKKKRFLISELFEYKIPAAINYICYEIQFRQTKPTTLIGNESVLVFNAVQILDLSQIQ